MFAISPLVTLIALLLIEQLCSGLESNFVNDEEIDNVCLKKTNITGAQLNYFMENPEEIEKSEPMLCYIKCNFEERSYVNDDGSISRELLIKQLKHIIGEESEDDINFECLESVKPIVSCRDIIDLMDCIESI